MNGLRLYTKLNGLSATNGENVFYSRRGNGPFYRWRYEDIVGQWRVSRVIDPDFNPHALSAAPMKAVPATLQTRLSQHYME
ncbi:MAG: hypothetical protein M3539_07545 [Acidobacteriota bacterium]|nr:hypothetical protein [Acidobacteriota bacterium]